MTSTPDVVAPPPGHPRFELLDALRAFAALGVLASHAALVSGTSYHAWYGSVFANGISGVTIFFVLSGFLLYRPFLAADLDGLRRVRIGDFARRRLLRILPAYWLALTVIGLWLHLKGVFGPHGWTYYALVQIYAPGTVPAGGLIAAWSLAVEISFYLVLPFYALGLSRLGRGMQRRSRIRLELAVLAILGVASTALRYDAVTGHMPFNTLPTTFTWFAIGMALAVLSVSGVPRLVATIGAHPGVCWTAAVVLYLIQAAILNTNTYTANQWMVQYVLSALVALALVLPAVLGYQAGGWPRRVMSWRVLGLVGLISYGVYLWQGAWVDQVATWGIPGGVPALPYVLALTLAGTIACAAISYRLVERPLMRFKNPHRATAPPVTRDTAGVPASGRVPAPDSAPVSPR